MERLVHGLILEKLREMDSLLHDQMVDGPD